MSQISSSASSSTSGIQACCICGKSIEKGAAIESARLKCNVREFSDQYFTIWRCPHCGSLHCLEDIDYSRYYADYPIRRQKYDFFAKQIFQKRIDFLYNAGLKEGNTLLDYGCGSGYFVRFARSKGILAEGYDPYSSEDFSNPAVLDRQYDFVTSQDVIEHDGDPDNFLSTLRKYVKPGGSLAIGTPCADKIDLGDPLAPLDAIHMPYHRHMYSRKELVKAMERNEWKVTTVIEQSYFDTRFPFVNSTFLVHLFRCGGGVMDAGFDPINPGMFLKNPSLVFWGLFGSWFPRDNDMVVIAQAPNR